MNIIPSLSITGGALDAERVRMDVVAQNIANANTTRDVDGKAYQRKVVTFESVIDDAMRGTSGEINGIQFKTVQVAAVVPDQSPGALVYNPSHPDADENGMVEMPNVEMAREMVDLISSSRAYEANLAVAKNAKGMAEAALRLARGQ